MAFTTCATERDPSVYRIINKGGVSLLIKKSLKQCTNAVPIESDRITGIEITLNDSAAIYIICVYLPASNLSNDLFHECLDLLEELYITYSSKGTVIIIGDLNVKIAGPKSVFARVCFILLLPNIIWFQLTFKVFARALLIFRYPIQGVHHLLSTTF